MNKGRVFVPGSFLFFVMLGLGAMAIQAETFNSTFADIPLYRILCTAGSVDLETLIKKCASHSLILSKTEDSRLTTEWDIDYRSAMRTDELLRRLGATTEIRIKGFPYQNLIKESRVPKQKFASFTDLITHPEIKEATVSSESIYKRIYIYNKSKGYNPQRADSGNLWLCGSISFPQRGCILAISGGHVPLYDRYGIAGYL